MLNTLIISCMLASQPAVSYTQQKDTTSVVIKFPKIKKPTQSTGNTNNGKK